MEYDIRLQFDSSIEQIEDINESFSAGIMRICYPGVNRNNSDVSKDAIERAKPTMFNCPVVCNYDIESDSIGGHDVELIHTNDGGMRIVNLTSAIGVVPSGAKTWWEFVEEGGTVHDYFTTEIILWKRSPAYQRVVDNGITSQSMEISVKSGHMQDGIFIIEDFTFTAFCLLGDDVEPCFESASLQMFGRNGIHQQFTAMMNEWKETFSLAQPSKEVGIHPQKYSEGGKKVLEQKKALAAEYGFDIDTLNFSVEDMTIDELREKFETMKAEQTPPASAKGENFALEGQFRTELYSALEAEQVETCWGMESRYWFWDYDREASEVYANDVTDWNLYGFPYSMDGDRVVIDFTGKKRMKLALVPFDEGSQANPIGDMFAKIVEKYTANDAKWAEKYQAASDTISSMESELGTLRQFKTDTESAAANGEREKVFAQFEDLAGIEAFEKLRESCADYSKEDLEEKCYAIRGRNGMAAKFSAEPKPPKLPVEQKDGIPGGEPYGGIFAEYGFSTISHHN